MCVAVRSAATAGDDESQPAHLAYWRMDTWNSLHGTAYETPRKKLRKKLGWSVQSLGAWTPWPPSGCALDCTIENPIIKVHSLYVIRALKGSQCSCWRSGRDDAPRAASAARRATQFCTRWSLWKIDKLEIGMEWNKVCGKVCYLIERTPQRIIFAAVCLHFQQIGLIDVWLCGQKSRSKSEKMSDYLHKYLRQTFGLEQIAVEWAYSLHDAAPQFTSNPQIALFWSVLIDEVSIFIICHFSIHRCVSYRYKSYSFFLQEPDVIAEC